MTINFKMTKALLASSTLAGALLMGACTTATPSQNRVAAAAATGAAAGDQGRTSDLRRGCSRQTAGGSAGDLCDAGGAREVPNPTCEP